MNPIERVRALDSQIFVERYVVPGRPVIVTDAMEGWPARRLWNPAYLSEKIGDIEVQVYDDLFGLKNVMPLADYFTDYFGQARDAHATNYVRGYSRLKSLDFYWADEAFSRLAPDWGTPAFMPRGGYLIPDEPLHAESSLAPYRGLFISGRGCRTRLHRDPWTTSAMLCQFHGTKRIEMYAPDQAAHLMDGDEFVDISNPDRKRFPNFDHARIHHQDTLVPGEILFIPGGWLHHVTTLTDSISVTWNFLHESGRASLCRFLAENPDDPELDVIKFFLRKQVREDASAAEIIAALETGAPGGVKATGRMTAQAS